MRFVTIKDIRSKSYQIQKELQKEKEMILTSSGNPIAILINVSRDTLEDHLRAFRMARAMLAAAHVQKQSVELGTNKISFDEINKIIAESRRLHNE